MHEVCLELSEEPEKKNMINSDVVERFFQHAMIIIYLFSNLYHLAVTLCIDCANLTPRCSM